ncbi:hypothetical protein GQ42DRAFT_165659 [Ramicandelaber brevisporus]|nr:hypothetical protein GQ42DRAFT_165659 [Ramicandelaber brevisporus]
MRDRRIVWTDWILRVTPSVTFSIALSIVLLPLHFCWCTSAAFPPHFCRLSAALLLHFCRTSSCWNTKSASHQQSW